MFSYDAKLLAAATSPSSTVTGVLETLRAIDQLCAEGDGLKWFNWMYLQVTEAVAARVNAAHFSDPAWMAELDVQFARLYFSALKTSLSGGTPPECWRVLFDNRSQPAITRLQFALAGINAHINHDLAEAVVATCQETGTTPDFGGPRYDDYTAVNTTLDTLIETAKHTLNVRLLGDALPPFARLEDTVAGWKVWGARELAWRNAGHLWHLRSSPLMVSTFEEMLDGFTTVIGKGLMVPIPCEV